MRYLDPAIAPECSDEELLVYAAACGAVYDEVGVPIEQLTSGDVVVTGPWSDWSWLPIQVGIEVLPDQTPPSSRQEPIIVALHDRGVPVGLRLDPPKTERSQYWERFHDAVSWSESVADVVTRLMTETPVSKAPFELVDTVDRALEVIQSLYGKHYGLDFETDTLDVHKIGRLGVALADHRMAYWIVDGVCRRVLPALVELLLDPDSQCRGSGFNYDYRVLMAEVPGFRPTDMPNPALDSQVMNWVWRGGSYRNDLKWLTSDLLGRDVFTFEDMGGVELFWEQSVEAQGAYAAGGDARNSYDLVDDLDVKLRQSHLDELYYGIELPVSPVLAEMQWEGLRLHRRQLLDLVDEYEQRRNGITSELAELGFKGTASNDGDIIRFLFRELSLPVLEKTPKKQQPRVAVDVLRQLSLLRETDPNVRKHLRHIELFVEFSEVDKALSTFLYPPLESMLPYLWAQIKQTSTVTGRISTSEPNIMNIPSRAGKRIRQIVIAPNGCILVDSDYSTLEPRVGAHMSQDEKMMDDFLNGRDVYISLARDMGLGEITKGSRERDNVKTIYLADLYGTSVVKMQVIALKEGRYLPLAEARKYQNGIHEARKEYYAWRDNIVWQARRDGGIIRDMFNRYRKAGSLYAVDPGSRAAGEREVMNFPNQSGAGGVIKSAMPAVQLLFRSAGGSLNNQIHDELLGYIKDLPESEREEFKHEMERIMTQTQTLSVPLLAETGFGNSWYEAKQ